MPRGKYKSSRDVKRELSKLLEEVRADKIELKKAETIKGILNSIQITINTEAKEREIEVQERLSEELERAREYE